MASDFETGDDMELESGGTAGLVSSAIIAVGAACRVLYLWIRRERKEDSLYKIELEAHENTRQELAQERTLRREVEMELERIRREHQSDREEWYRQRTEDRERMDQMHTEMRGLKDEVADLNKTLRQNGISRSS